jgi:hypothetical protein
MNEIKGGIVAMAVTGKEILDSSNAVLIKKINDNNEAMADAMDELKNIVNTSKE